MKQWVILFMKMGHQRQLYRWSGEFAEAVQVARDWTAEGGKFAGGTAQVFSEPLATVAHGELHVPPEGHRSAELEELLSS